MENLFDLKAVILLTVGAKTWNKWTLDNVREDLEIELRELFNKYSCEWRPEKWDDDR